MIFFIVAFFYGSMLVASEQDGDVKRQLRMDLVISRIINAHYEPVGNIKIKSCSDIKKETRRLNGGMLPIPLQAKQPIIDLLVQEFGQNRKDAVTYFKEYGTAFKIYDLSIEKTLELLTHQYESDSESSSDSSCDIEYESSKFFASLFYNKFSLNNDKK